MQSRFLPNLLAEKFGRARPTRPALAIISLILVLLGACLSVSAQSRAVTVPRNLADLVAESPTIVQGWVTQVTLAPDDHLRNLVTVVVTLRVEETIRGSASGTYTFRQAVIDARDKDRKMGYQPGQHILLLLIKPSQFGLSSPAGMEQGKFRISVGRDGKLSATNELGNVGLFRDFPTKVQQSASLTPETRKLISKPNPGPVALDQLKTVIRTISSMMRNQ